MQRSSWLKVSIKDGAQDGVLGGENLVLLACSQAPGFVAGYLG